LVWPSLLRGWLPRHDRVGHDQHYVMLIGATCPVNLIALISPHFGSAVETVLTL
jgi:hypothetical protein